MELNQIIQTVAIIVSLVIALGGWLINWRQRVNDKKAKLVSTIVIDQIHSSFNKQPQVFAVQTLNIGVSTAVLLGVKLSEVDQDNKEVIIVEDQENLNLPLFANQKFFVNFALERDKHYSIRVSYTTGNSKKINVFESGIISSNAIDVITPLKQWASE